MDFLFFGILLLIFIGAALIINFGVAGWLIVLLAVLSTLIFLSMSHGKLSAETFLTNLFFVNVILKVVFFIWLMSFLVLQFGLLIGLLVFFVVFVLVGAASSNG